MYSFMREELAGSITSQLESEGLATKQEDKKALRQIILESIEDYFDDKIADVWDSEDVVSKAREMDITLGKEQAIEVLEMALNKFDAGEGINWSVLGTYIREVDGR